MYSTHEFDGRKHTKNNTMPLVQFSVRYNGQYVTDHGCYDTLAYLKNKEVLCYDHSKKRQVIVNGEEARELGIEMLDLVDVQLTESTHDDRKEELFSDRTRLVKFIDLFN